MSCTTSISGYVSSDRIGASLSSGVGVEVERSTRDLFRTRTDEYSKATPHFKEFLAFLIADVPQVRALFMHQEKRLLRIFIVTDQFEFDVNEKIYDREEHIMDVFTNFDFDFHITCQRDISDPGLELVLSR